MNKFIIIFLFISYTIFGIGLHNMDLAQNLKYINSEYSLDLVDVDSFGNVNTPQELYRSGFNLIFLSVNLVMIITLITNDAEK